MGTFYQSDETLPASFVGQTDSTFYQNEIVWYRYINSLDTSGLSGAVSYGKITFSTTSWNADLLVRLRIGKDLLGPSANNPSNESNFGVLDDGSLVDDFVLDHLGSFSVFVCCNDINSSGNTDFRIHSLIESLTPPFTYDLVRVGMNNNSDVNKRFKLEVLELFEDTPTEELTPSSQVIPGVELTPEPFFNFFGVSNYDAQMKADIDLSDPIELDND